MLVSAESETSPRARVSELGHTFQQFNSFIIMIILRRECKRSVAVDWYGTGTIISRAECWDFSECDEVSHPECCIQSCNATVMSRWHGLEIQISRILGRFVFNDVFPTSGNVWGWNSIWFNQFKAMQSMRCQNYDLNREIIMIDARVEDTRKQEN